MLNCYMSETRRKLTSSAIHTEKFIDCIVSTNVQMIVQMKNVDHANSNMCVLTAAVEVGVGTL